MTPTLWFEGAHLSPSPSGTLLASIIEDGLRICFTASPERCIDFPTRSAPKDVLDLCWAADSSRVMILTASLIEILDLEDEQSRARLQNGSSGLGRFSTADFLQPDQVLTVWEFGRARIWNLNNGQSLDIANIKTSGGRSQWATRPSTSSARLVFAYLSCPAADDLLIIQFPGESAALAPIKLPTVDARSLHWSPDGHWLVVLDSARQYSNVLIFTADGHLYKSYPAIDRAEDIGLGIKSVSWGPTSQVLALSRHDGCIELISGRTLSQTAIIEHSTLIDQKDSTRREQTRIWQEVVSASSTRSYKDLTMPVAPPLFRTKATHDPRELGIAEVAFSCDGKYLASRDESMLSTVWVWDVQELRPQTVIIQHSNIRRMRWHARIAELLMIDCAENIVYLVDVASSEAPKHVVVLANGNVVFSFSESNVKSATILATTKTSFSIIHTSAHSAGGASSRTSNAALRAAIDEEDSLFDILSGRVNTDLSHTERLELDAAAQEHTVQLDDTFDGRHLKHSSSHDPLDDSDIF